MQLTLTYSDVILWHHVVMSWRFIFSLFFLMISLGYFDVKHWFHFLFEEFFLLLNWWWWWWRWWRHLTAVCIESIIMCKLIWGQFVRAGRKLCFCTDVIFLDVSFSVCLINTETVEVSVLPPSVQHFVQECEQSTFDLFRSRQEHFLLVLVSVWLSESLFFKVLYLMTSPASSVFLPVWHKPVNLFYWSQRVLNRSCTGSEM